eukprot:Clim_evm17s213 gene=Clim_evmTU17s213
MPGDRGKQPASRTVPDSDEGQNDQLSPLPQRKGSSNSVPESIRQDATRDTRNLVKDSEIDDMEAQPASTDKSGSIRVTAGDSAQAESSGIMTRLWQASKSALGVMHIGGENAPQQNLDEAVQRMGQERFTVEPTRMSATSHTLQRPPIPPHKPSLAFADDDLGEFVDPECAQYRESSSSWIQSTDAEHGSGDHRARQRYETYRSQGAESLVSTQRESQRSAGLDFDMVSVRDSNRDVKKNGRKGNVWRSTYSNIRSYLQNEDEFLMQQYAPILEERVGGISSVGAGSRLPTTKAQQEIQRKRAETKAQIAIDEIPDPAEVEDLESIGLPSNMGDYARKRKSVDESSKSGAMKQPKTVRHADLEQAEETESELKKSHSIRSEDSVVYLPLTGTGEYKPRISLELIRKRYMIIFLGWQLFAWVLAVLLVIFQSSVFTEMNQITVSNRGSSQEDFENLMESFGVDAATPPDQHPLITYEIELSGWHWLQGIFQVNSRMSCTLSEEQCAALQVTDDSDNPYGLTYYVAVAHRLHGQDSFSLTLQETLDDDEVAFSGFSDTDDNPNTVLHNSVWYDKDATVARFEKFMDVESWRVFMSVYKAPESALTADDLEDTITIVALDKSYQIALLVILYAILATFIAAYATWCRSLYVYQYQKWDKLLLEQLLLVIMLLPLMVCTCNPMYILSVVFMPWTPYSFGSAVISDMQIIILAALLLLMLLVASPSYRKLLKTYWFVSILVITGFLIYGVVVADDALILLLGNGAIDEGPSSSSHEIFLASQILNYVFFAASVLYFVALYSVIRLVGKDLHKLPYMEFRTMQLGYRMSTLMAVFVWTYALIYAITIAINYVDNDQINAIDYLGRPSIGNMYFYFAYSMAVMYMYLPAVASGRRFEKYSHFRKNFLAEEGEVFSLKLALRLLEFAVDVYYEPESKGLDPDLTVHPKELGYELIEHVDHDGADLHSMILIDPNDPNRLIVTFRGTYSSQNVKTDLDFRLKLLPDANELIETAAKKRKDRNRALHELERLVEREGWDLNCPPLEEKESSDEAYESMSSQTRLSRAAARLRTSLQSSLLGRSSKSSKVHSCSSSARQSTSPSSHDDKDTRSSVSKVPTKDKKHKSGSSNLKILDLDPLARESLYQQYCHYQRDHDRAQLEALVTEDRGAVLDRMIPNSAGATDDLNPLEDQRKGATRKKYATMLRKTSVDASRHLSENGHENQSLTETIKDLTESTDVAETKSSQPHTPKFPAWHRASAGATLLINPHEEVRRSTESSAKHDKSNDAYDQSRPETRATVMHRLLHYIGDVEERTGDAVLNATTRINNAALYLGRQLGISVAQPKAHRGFLKAYSRLHPRLQKSVLKILEEREIDEVMVCGHSLGGALSEICAIYMNLWLPPRLPVHVYTYGTPRIGNQALVKLMDELIPFNFRLVSDGDIVTAWHRIHYHPGTELVLGKFGTINVDPSFIERFFVRSRSNPSAHACSEYERRMGLALEKARDKTRRQRLENMDSDEVMERVKEAAELQDEEDRRRSTVFHTPRTTIAKNISTYNEIEAETIGDAGILGHIHRHETELRNARSNGPSKERKASV